MKKIMPKKIIISGEIGWEINPDGIRKALDEAAGEDLDIYIASPGGSVFRGIEIFNLFRDYKRTYPASQITATIKGMAASMATYLAVNPAFDLLAAEDNAVFMIHNAWGGVVGDYREVGKMAEVLNGVTQIIGRAYAARTGKSLKKIREMMDEETWLFGEEIKDAGFVDEIVKGDDSEPDKNAAITQARAAFSALSKKLAETPENYAQIAALITEAPAHNPASTAGKNTMEVAPMTLKELLDANPAAKAEYDALLKNHEDEKKAQFEAGKKEGETAIKARIEKAAPFVGSKSYPAKVSEHAIAVIKGEKPIESLDIVVATLDAIREQGNSAAAKTESADTAAATAQQEPTRSQDGVIRTEADLMDEVNAAKKNLGQEVK